jgi:hypothetical protein
MALIRCRETKFVPRHATYEGLLGLAKFIDSVCYCGEICRIGTISR